MERYYQIVISKVIYQHIKQKNRTLLKKQFVIIGRIHNIPLSELSKKVIEVNRKYRDFNYIVDFEREAKK